MKRYILVFVLIIITGVLTLLRSDLALTQGGESDTARITLTIPAIRVVDVSPKNLDFGTPSSGEFSAGHTNPKQLKVTVRSNAEWALQVEGTKEHWDGPWQKPVTDIEWHFEGGAGGGESAWNELTTWPVIVTRGSATRKWEKNFLVRVKLDWEKDVEGEYTYESILFTVAAP